MDNYCSLWINMPSYPHKRVKNQLYRVECKTTEFYQHFAIKKYANYEYYSIFMFNHQQYVRITLIIK